MNRKRMSRSQINVDQCNLNSPLSVTEISLMTRKNCTAMVRAASLCNLFSLSKDHFDHILVTYPVMKRTLETIAAQRLHHLGKDPALIASRESLLDDITGFRQVMQVSKIA